MITFALVAIAKATLVCGVAILLSRVSRRRRASFRHLLFVLVFAALAVMPVAGVVLPSLSVPVTVPARAITETSRLSEITQVVLSSSNAEASKMNRAKALFHPEPASDSPSKSEALSHRRQSVTLAELMIAAWLLGAALFVLPVIAGLWQVRRLRQTASPWMNGREPLQTLGIRRGF